jgi:transposase InsO family protein
MSNATKGIPIPQFDGQSNRWPIFKQRFKAAMLVRGLWQHLNPARSIQKKGLDSLTEEKEVDLKKEVDSESGPITALACLIHALPDDLLSAYAPNTESEVSVVWSNLCEHFESNSMMNKSHLRTKLLSTRMKSGQLYLAYHTEIMETVRALKGMQVSLTDEEVVHHLLTGLTPAFDQVRSFLQMTNESNLNKVHQHLVQHAERLVIDGHTIEAESTFFGRSSSGGGRQFGNRFNQGSNSSNRSSRDCFTCGKSDHLAFDCPQNKDKKRCNFCRAIGSHVENECRKKKKNSFNMNSSATSSSSSSSGPGPAVNLSAVAIVEESDEELFYLGQEDSSSSSSLVASCDHEIASDQFSRAVASTKAPKNSNSIRLTLDSGATIATCKDLHQMHSVREVKPIRVKVANNQTVVLDRMGSLRVRTIDGAKTFVIQDVYYWPDCPVNLLSIASLTKNGKEVVFASDGAVIRKVGLNGQPVPVLNIPRRGNLYVLDMIVASDEKNTAMPVTVDSEVNQSESVSMWHNRLGHIGLSQLAKLVKSPTVSGLESIRLFNLDHASTQPLCHGCSLGKLTRKKFTRLNSGDPAAEILDRIHADIKGPIDVPTKGGSRYLLALTDEKSRKTWGFLLKQKSDAPQLIIGLLDQLRVETGKTLREFHSDNGGEFVNIIMKQYFTREGINQTTTTPGTSNHNSIAERAFRTIFNSVRSMLFHAQLPAGFWGHAALTAIRLKNMTLTSVNGEVTPDVIWRHQAFELNHHHRLSQSDQAAAESRQFVTKLKNLRTFGCNVYHHLQDQKATEPRAGKGIFLGYVDDAKGYYHILDLNSKKLIKRRDVVFDEKNFTFVREFTRDRYRPIQVPGDDDHEIDIINKESESDSIVPASSSGGASALEPIESGMDSEYKSDSELEEENDESDSAVDPVNAGELEISDSDSVSAPPIRTPRKQKEPNLLDIRESNILSTKRERTQRVLAVAPESTVPAEESPVPIEGEEVNDPEPDFTPETWSEAMNCLNADHWVQAANEEIEGMQMNQSYELVDRPIGANVIDSKWVWKKKLSRWGKVKRFRARLTARGFKQIPGVDFFETFAPVMRYRSLKMLLTIAAERDYEIRHLDVPKAFLQADLAEAIYMEQPQGFHNGNRNQVWKLLKSVYGIKQAPNNWNEDLNRFLLSLGFIRLKSDSCIYAKSCRSGRLLGLGVFVDDIIPIFSNDSEDRCEWDAILGALSKKYNINDTGDVSMVLGIRVTRNRARRTIKLDHAPYVAKILKEYRLTECNPYDTPSSSYRLSKADCPQTDEDRQSAPDQHLYQRMVGSLNFAAITCRADIAYAVNILARYLQNPGSAHMVACKRVFHYLKGTPELGIILGGRSASLNIHIDAWSDADWGGDRDGGRSTTGYLTFLNGSLISWSSKRQSVVSQSTCEAEYYAVSAVVSETKWMRQFLEELLDHDHHGQDDESNRGGTITVTGHIDNTSTIAVIKNDVHHNRTKHIDIRHHFIREAVAANLFQPRHVPGVNQLADICTKALGRIIFERLRADIMSY